MAEPTNSHWRVTFDRDVEKWGVSFTEYWTCIHRKGSVTYELRVVGPDGEAFRRKDLDKASVPSDVRKSFKDMFRHAGEIA